MTAEKQVLLFANTARAIGDAPREVKLRYSSNCQKADPAYTARELPTRSACR
jgi:catalase